MGTPCPTSPRPLSVVSHLAPGVQPLYELAARRMGERLGRLAAFTVAASYARCAADIDDVCSVCSVPYLLFVAYVEQPTG